MAGKVIGQPAFIDGEDLAADNPDKLAAALIEPAPLSQDRDRFIGCERPLAGAQVDLGALSRWFPVIIHGHMHHLDLAPVWPCAFACRP
jgi:hypothetical protein